MSTFEDLHARLLACDQAHLLAGWSRLPDAGRARLVANIEQLDLAAVPALSARVRGGAAAVELSLDRLEPPVAVAEAGSLPAEVRARGEAALRAGRVAAFVVAGGDGTRLGFNGPKGAFPAGPVSGKSLFALLAEGVLATGRRYGARVPWWVMTSPENHEATVQFFDVQGFFGLSPADVHFVVQGTLPTFDTAGRLMLAAPDRVATHPDGHGGSVHALAHSGALDTMAARGIDLISYFQVDNPLARVLDPEFLGLHLDPARSSAEMSAKVVPKTEPGERVGVFARVDGALQVVEYSDLPASLAAARDGSGRLRYAAGNVAQHILDRDFVARLAAAERDPADTFALPLHRAHKVIAGYDPVTDAPCAVDAVKLERFVFDAMARCAQPALLAVSRAEAFAPIKNAEGADSPHSSAEALSERAARWLAAAGVTVPRTAAGRLDCVLELSALTAMEAADLQGQSDLPTAILPGERWCR